MKKFILTSFLILLISSSISPAIPSIVNTQELETRIVIGVITSRTGYYSYYGDMEINGLILGLMYELNISDFDIVSPNYRWRLVVGSKEIYIIAKDDINPEIGEPDPQIAAQMAKELVKRYNAQILLGGISSITASAIASIAIQHGAVFIASPADDRELTGSLFNRHVFQLSSIAWHRAIAAAPYVINLGRKIAFIAPDDPWGYSEVDCWRAKIEKLGGEVVAVEYVPSMTRDFTEYILRILASNADNLVLLWPPITSYITLKQLALIGVFEEMKIITYLPDLYALNLELPSEILFNLTGLIEYSWNLLNNSPNTWLVRKYTELYKENHLPAMSNYRPPFPLPDIFVASGFVVGQAIGKALEKIDWKVSSDALIEALEGMTIESPRGLIKIRSRDHRVIQDMYIAGITWDNMSLSTYYEKPEYLPSIYRDLYKKGVFKAKLLSRVKYVEPPIEVQIEISPWSLTNLLLILTLILTPIVILVIFFHRKVRGISK